MVLVQWQGLPPDETSWEDWASLKRTHHLEDKVLLDGQGSVTGEVREGVSLAREVQEARNERPRRERLTPAYLEGYDRSHAEWRNA